MLTVETYDTLAEAANAVRDRSHFLAGGTLVMRGVNYGDQSFDRIIRTRDPSICDIRPDGGGIRIGAGVTMAKIAAATETAFLAPVARIIGGPAIRNMATVGGNLFARHPFGDFAGALLALDATVHMADGGQTAIESFLANRDNARGLVAAVSVARPTGDGFRFVKVTRVKPRGAAVMSISALLPRQAGRLSNARIVFGGMGKTPLRAKAAETALEGVTLDQAGIDRALAVATDGLDPPTDTLASDWYRREVAPVHLRRLLLDEGRR